MQLTKAELGRYGEELAAAHLEATGCRILARNWRCRLGEIDVVALEGQCLVVCEVKTRRSLAAGDPLESVTALKAGRLRRLAGAWLSTQQRFYPDVRIDVVGIVRPASGPARLRHLKGVV
ncbi:YraN family protein [Kineosporia corallincola]|nr:YraN family protein [Kineosporia corallincola]